MRTTFLACVFAAAACGCGGQGPTTSETVGASGNEDSKSNPATAASEATIVTLRGEAKDHAGRMVPVVPRDAEFRVQGEASVGGLPKERQRVIVQILHSEGGKEVMYNSAVPEEKREKDVVKFEAVMKSPSKPGSFRVIAVNGDRVFCSSPVTVE